MFDLHIDETSLDLTGGGSKDEKKIPLLHEYSPEAKPLIFTKGSLDKKAKNQEPSFPSSLSEIESKNRRKTGNFGGLASQTNQK